MGSAEDTKTSVDTKASDTKTSVDTKASDTKASDMRASDMKVLVTKVVQGTTPYLMKGATAAPCSTTAAVGLAAMVAYRITTGAAIRAAAA